MTTFQINKATRQRELKVNYTSHKSSSSWNQFTET